MTPPRALFALACCLFAGRAAAEVRDVPVPLAGEAARWQVGGVRVNYTLGRSELAPSAELSRPGAAAPGALRLTCDFVEPQRWFVSAYRLGEAIPGECRELKLWLWAGGSGSHVRLSLEDARGRWFERDLGPADWQGWKLLTVPVGDGTGWQPLLRRGEERLPVLHPINLRQIAILRGAKSTGLESYFLQDLQATSDVEPSDLVQATVTTGRPGNLFTPGETAPVTVKLTSRGDKPVSGRLQATVTDFFGTEQSLPAGEITVPAGQTVTRVLPCRAQRLGTFEVRVSLKVGSRERVWFGRVAVTRSLPDRPADPAAMFGACGNFDGFSAEQLPLVSRLNRDAGLRWARIGLGWEEVNPAPDSWCWEPGKLVAAPFGKALELSGTAFRVQHTPVLDCPDAVTVAFFARGTKANGQWQFPVQKWGASNRRNYGVYFSLETGEFCFSGTFANRPPGSWNDFPAGFSAWDGRWHHYAATYSRTEKRVRMYVDGALKKTHDFDGGALTTNSEDLLVGSGFAGGLGDVVISRRALSDAEVKALAAGSQPPNDGLVGWWKLDAVGAEMPDRSGHGLTLRVGEPYAITTAREALKSGIKTLGILGFPPTWASTAPPGAARPWVYKPNLEAWAKYVEAVTRQYADVIQHWEIWNEPNIDVFWEPKPSAKEYLDVLRVGYAAAKRGNPECKVLMPTLAGPIEGGFGLDFLDELLRAGAVRYCDAISMHPYRQGTPEDTDLVGQLKHIAELAEQNGGRRALWFTENCWTTQLPDGSTERRQALMLPRGYVLALGTGLMERLIWFRLHDSGLDRFYSEDNYGMCYNDLTPKPAWHAHRTIATLLEGAKADGEWQAGPRALARCFRVKGERVAGIWCPEGEETVAIRSARPARLTDIMGNETTLKPVEGAIIVRAGEAMQFLSGLGDDATGAGALVAAKAPVFARGQSGRVTVTLSNPFSEARAVKLTLGVPAPLTTATGTAEARVPAGGRADVSFAIAAPAAASAGECQAALACDFGGLRIAQTARIAARSAAADAGPVGLWHLDEGQGSVIRDASPSGNNGTVEAPKWVPGHKGTALQFDGAAVATIPNAPSLNLADEVTLAFWLRVDADTGTWQFPIEKYLGDQRRNYGIYVSPGTLAPSFSASFERGAFRHSDVASGVSLKPGEWHHIAATYSMFAHRLRLFVDGKIATDQGLGDGAMLLTNEPLRLGVGAKVTLDEVAIYPRALSPDEVAELAKE